MSNEAMTRAVAITRAKAMRDLEIRWLLVACNPKRSFGDRYEAMIKAEDCEEAARRFDTVAEREKAK